MRVEVVTQPEPLVDLETVNTALGEDGERDVLIRGLLLAAQAYLDGPKSITGVAVAPQTVRVYFDNFDTGIVLPGETIADPLTSLTYRDGAGAFVPFDPAVYLMQKSGRLALVSGATWPSVAAGGDGVVAEYELGITDEDDPRIELMKTAIIMHVKMTLDMADPAVYQRVIENLVSPIRAMSV